MTERSPYPNLPSTESDWANVVESAKDAFWQAFRDGKTPTEAFLSGLDEAFRSGRLCGYIE